MGRKINKVQVDLCSYPHYLIMGVKKVGKTTLFADLVDLLYPGHPEKGLLISCGNEEGYKALDDLQYEEAREWDKYCYNRLVSYYDGFETCLDVINDMLLTDSENDVLLDMKYNYRRIQNHIKTQMDYLQDQIFALYSYLGDFSSIGAKDFIDSNCT